MKRGRDVLRVVAGALAGPLRPVRSVPVEPMPESDEPYCGECGADGNRVAYVEAHADSEEWRCKDCGTTFSWREGA